MRKKQIKTILKITDKYLASSIYFLVTLLTSKLYHQNVRGGNPDSISAKFELTPEQNSRVIEKRRKQRRCHGDLDLTKG